MNKTQFCNKVKAYVDDEKKASIDYFMFQYEARQFLEKRSPVRKISKDEARHLVFWQKVNKNVCGR